MTWQVWLIVGLAGGLALGLGLATLGVAGLVLAPLAGGLACLLCAGVTARREQRVFAARRPYCQDCGASVPVGAALCPWCRSPNIVVPAPSDRPGRRGSGGTGPQGARDLPVTAYSPDASGVIGWVDQPPGGWAAAETPAATAMRRWAVALLVVGGLTGMVVAAVAAGSWVAAAPVLLVTAGVGAVIARWGPGAH